MTSAVMTVVGIGVAALYVLAGWTALRHRSHPAVPPFVFFTVVFAAIAAISGIGVPSITFVLFIGLVLAELTWLLLVFEYTGRTPTSTRWVLLGCGLLAVVAIVPPVIAVFVGVQRPVVLLLAHVTQTTLLAVFVYGISLVVVAAAQYSDFDRGDIVVLGSTGGGIVGYLLIRIGGEGGFISQTGELWSMLGLLGALAIVLIGVQRHYRPFAGDPSAGYLAREAVIDRVDEAVLLTDREDRLVDYNDPARELFALESATDTTQPIHEVFGADRDTLSGSTAILETRVGRREFDVTRLPLSAEGEGTIGHAYRLRDISDRKTDKERLTVLNRVLRHNLRNDFDAMLGFSETVERSDLSSDEARRLLDRLYRLAASLEDRCEMVALTEQLLSRESPIREPVTIDELISEAVAALPEEHRVRVERELPPGQLVAETDDRLLVPALTEVLENAFAHADHDDPQVTITVQRSPTEIRIDVADDGPGISAAEREILLRGEESPLRHGTGFGLWFVHWTLRKLGGAVEFAENEPRGSVMSIVLPTEAMVSSTESDRRTPD